MRAVLWVVFALGSCAFTVWVCARMSNPTLVPPGEQVRQVRDYQGVAAAVDEARLRGVIEHLSSLGSRVTGYRGARRAADYMADAFREIGLEDVRREPFRVAVPMDRGASLHVEGDERPVPLACLWPNLVRTPTVPLEGLRGPLVYGGRAQPREFNGQDMAGAIALLEFDCQTDWLNAFLLGARAVVFIEPEAPLRPEAEAKFLTVPADTPRFWVSRAQGLALKERVRGAEGPVQVTLTGRMDWVDAEATNVLAELPGTNEAAAEGVVVFSAYYDSMSVVPALSPGAEQACSAAALLELARTLKRHPLQRRVVFLATAGHGEAMAGAKAFVRRHILGGGEEGEGGHTVAVFVALDLSSHSRRLGLFYKGHAIDQGEIIQPWFSHLGEAWSRWAGEVCEALGWRPEAAFADCVNSAQGKNWRTHLPGHFAFEGELATLAGCPGLTFATTDDGRFCIDTPLDTLEPGRMDMGNLAAQAKLLCCALPNFFNTAGAFIRKRPENYWTRLEARAVEFNFKEDYLPNEPLPGALVVVRGATPQKSLCGVRGEPVLLTDREGTVTIEGLPERRAVGAWRATQTLAAFRLDPQTGVVTYAPDLGPEGARNYPLDVEMNAPAKEATVVCFKGRALTIFDLADQRYYVPFDTIQVLDAGTNSSPINYGYLLPRNPPWMSATETCAVVFAKPGTHLRILMGAGPIGKRMLLLNASKEAPLGTGFVVGQQGGAVPLTPLRAARDMWHLDDHRARQFRAHGLENPRVDILHASAARRLDRAATALARKDYAAFLSHSRAAWALEARSYPEVLGMANDVVKGLVFYLVLVLPFAFFCERLLLNRRSVVGRILGTTGAFVVVFLLLAVFHPAFRVAISPLMILLAFIVLTLSVVVITLVVRRFEELMAEQRAAASGVHAADVRRLSAALTAFFLGIGHLRKRPIRTTLTATTIILLAFSVLSLAAVVQYLEQTVVPYPGEEVRYEGLLLRSRQWEAISEIGLDALRTEYGDSVVPRAWYYSAMVGEQSFVGITGGPQGRTVYASAVVGLAARESEVTKPQEALAAGRWLEEGRAEILLPLPIAEALGMSAEDAVGSTVQLFGRGLEVVGLVDPARMLEVTDLDRELLTPVDHVAMAQRRREEGPPDSDVVEEYVHLAPENVAIAPYEFVVDAGGELRSIAVLAADAEEVAGLLDELMPRTELTLFAGREGEAYLFSSRGASTITGAGSLLVPTVLAALIVFNTMLGSIYERQGEIGILSSVGLAPKHIGALFLAESVVYAVVGTVVGYLLGQSISRVIHAYGLLPGLQLNYSSMSTVLLSVFIMVVVVGSSIYPALQARRIAAPALQIRWQLPEPVDDTMAMELPFTVTHDTALGVNAYLEEYFQAHTGAAMGGFAAEDVTLEALRPPPRRGLRVAMTAWLAPFDVGVSQGVAIETYLLPDGIFYGMELRLGRKSGDQGSWRRLNRHFTDLIRKQFLIWRVLRPAARETYVARAAQRLGEDQPEAATQPPSTGTG
ncbi:MAG: FtsX-like permease family protein [Candidatus Brocadiia bacterium]